MNSPLCRLPVVGVMGSSRQAYPEKTRPLGRWLARTGVNLLTGGGGGVMAAVSEAFCSVEQRSGRVIGVIPATDSTTGAALPGDPNQWTEVPIRTHLPMLGDSGEDPLSRNHINILSSDVIVALPGTAGTASETRLAMRYGRPIVAFLEPGDEIPGLPGDIPVKDSMGGIQAFVENHLERISRV